MDAEMDPENLDEDGARLAEEGAFDDDFDGQQSIRWVVGMKMCM